MSLASRLTALAQAVGADVKVLTTDVNALKIKTIPFVTVLPGIVSDGQEVYFVVDATKGILWHLKYRAASTSAYKWEFVGGSRIVSENNAGYTVAMTTVHTLTTDTPSVTLPLNGDYLIEYGGQFGFSSGIVDDLVVTVGLDATNKETISNIWFYFGTAAQFRTFGQQKTVLTGCVANQLVRMFARSQTANRTLTYSGRTIAVRPIRVA